MTVFILKINFKLFIKKYLILNKNNDNIKKLYVFYLNIFKIIIFIFNIYNFYINN